MLELPYYAIASDGSIPLFIGGTLAQRPEPGQPNRLYIVFEPTGNYLSRDTGAGWENVGSSEGASSILRKLLTVDGAGSGLDADLLDGLQGADYGRSDDARLSNARPPTAHKATHEPGGADALSGLTNASIAANAGIIKSKLAALDIANADVVAGAAIAETKLALASDAAVGTPSRRTLGTGATQALPGNHSSTTDTRTPTNASVTPAKMSAENKGVIICASTTRPASPVEGQLIYETDTDQVLKNTGTPAAPVWVNTATASASATEAAEGIAQQGTAQQIIDGAAGNLFPTVARLKAYIDSRLTPEAWIAPALTNGWVNFGVPYGTAAFRKEPYGLVRLRGVVKSGTTGTATPIFTLPVGYRPAAGAMNPGENNGPYQTVDVQPDGKVSVYGAASNVRVSLDAVVFAVSTTTP